MFHVIKVQNARDQIRHFEVARETGRDGCESALWDCFGDKFATMLKISPTKKSHNALENPSRAGLGRITSERVQGAPNARNS